jgi:hypothetical protein
MSWPSWPAERGNTYSNVSTHGTIYEARLWLPADLVHGMLSEELAIVNPPTAADIISDAVVMPYDDLWRGVLDRDGEEPVYVFERIDSGSDGPAHRRDSVLISNTGRGRLILLGGTSSVPLADLWVFEATGDQQWW